VQVTKGDALSIDLPTANKVVANLPYSISSPITFRLLEEVPFESAVLMYQREFAERLLSQPRSRDYSRLTIEVTYRADVERVRNVQAREFYPVPKVDSTVVRMVPRKSGPFARDNMIFDWLIRGIYSYPNKQIRKALRIWFQNLKYDSEASERLVKKCLGSLSGNERLREMGLDTLVQLSDAVVDMIEDGMLRGPRSNPI
jgi:16S rRNA (adenine1518-N6/adenine1519-N6)-dimethyltransferase